MNSIWSCVFVTRKQPTHFDSCVAFYVGDATYIRALNVYSIGFVFCFNFISAVTPSPDSPVYSFICVDLLNYWKSNRNGQWMFNARITTWAWHSKEHILNTFTWLICVYTYMYVMALKRIHWNLESFVCIISCFFAITFFFFFEIASYLVVVAAAYCCVYDLYCAFHYQYTHSCSKNIPLSKWTVWVWNIDNSVFGCYSKFEIRNTQILN